MGLLRYGMKYEPIQENLLPMKSVKEMYNRQKNRCHRVEHNCIRVRPSAAPSPAGSEGSNKCHANKGILSLCTSQRIRDTSCKRNTGYVKSSFSNGGCGNTGNISNDRSNSN